MSEEEFEFVKLKRLEFLKRKGYFNPQDSNLEEKAVGAGLVRKKEALGSPINEDLKVRIHRYTPLETQNSGSYEPSNMIYTRDSLYWSWRRVKEYYRDFLGIEDEGRGKKDIRIDPQIRK